MPEIRKIVTSKGQYSLKYEFAAEGGHFWVSSIVLDESRAKLGFGPIMYFVFVTDESGQEKTWKVIKDSEVEQVEGVL